MRNIGLLLLGVSLILGAVSLWGVSRLSTVEAKPTPQQVAVTQIVVAQRSIGFGERITSDSVKTEGWPAGLVPDGSFHTISEVTTGGGRRALGAIAAGEPILAARLSGPGGRATFATVIRPGMRASAIRVDDVLGVAGFVLPGDSVDVLVTHSDSGDRTAMRTDLLLQDVRVLAVDQVTDESKNHPVLAKTATIEVSPAQAEKLALASQVGSLSLSLRPPADKGTVAPETMRVTDLGQIATPKRERPARVARSSGPAQPTMEIYRGVQVSSVAVAPE